MIPDRAMAHYPYSAQTRFVDVKGRKIACRSVGTGEPIILCNRLWGYLDSWDPAFISALARNFTVVTFDYSGFGLSTGKATFEQVFLANDVKDLANALGYEKVVIGGWSFGGMAAQACAMQYPDLVSHAVLITTDPPGENPYPSGHRCVDALLKPHCEVVAEAGTNACDAGSEGEKALAAPDISAPQVNQGQSVSYPKYERLLNEKVGEDHIADTLNVRGKLKLTSIPILVISGDSDLVSPVENWYLLTRELPTTQLIVFPKTGHRPHQQFPDVVAEHISMFVQDAASDLGGCYE